MNRNFSIFYPSNPSQGKSNFDEDNHLYPVFNYCGVD